MADALQKLEQHVDETLALELTKGVPDNKPVFVTENISGFKISRELSGDEVDARTHHARRASHERSQKITALMEARHTLREKLTESGITPIAILPEKAWGELCAAHGLYRFEGITDEARASYSHEHLFETASTGAVLLTDLVFAFVLCGIFAAVFGVNTFTIAALGIMLVTTGLATYFEWQRGEDSWEVGLVLTIGTTSAGFISGYSGIPTADTVGHVVFGGVTALVSFIGMLRFYWHVAKTSESFFTRLMIRSMPKRMLFKGLWPEGVARKANAWTQEIHIQFPTPPESFAQSLSTMRARAFAPSIAAVPEAVHVARSELLEGDWIEQIGRAHV